MLMEGSNDLVCTLSFKTSLIAPTPPAGPAGLGHPMRITKRAAITGKTSYRIPSSCGPNIAREKACGQPKCAS